MLRGLRLRLTALYSAAALALVALVGGGVYLLLDRYFGETTDLALQHKMVHEFYLLEAPIPPGLAAADRDWSAIRGLETRTREDEGRDDHDHDEEGDPWSSRQVDLAFNAELASIFVMPLDAGGSLLFDPNSASPPIAPDREALASALANGSDVRTVQGPDGQEVRLLTYRLTRDDGPVALQLGRVLGDQQLALRELLTATLVLSAIGALMIGLLSWWVAGRALLPTQLAWARQQNFVAGASHELRTPLTLMRASTEVALRALPAGDADRRELLGDVLHEIDHMGHLVEDLLILTRLDAGQLPLAREAIDLAELVADVARQFGRLAADHRLTLCYEVPPVRALADPTRLRQVLLILLDNALRHTPAGGTLTVAARPESRQMLRLTVSDTGSGIAPEHLPHVFERFYRADAARGAAGNAGLGLSIARGLVEAMGGHIGATSPPGQGATIWLTLPLAV